MAPTASVFEICQNLAASLRLKFSPIPVVESVAADNNPYFVIGNGVPGQANAIIKVGNSSLLTPNHMGGTSIVYGDPVIQLQTEANDVNGGVPDPLSRLQLGSILQEIFKYGTAVAWYEIPNNNVLDVTLLPPTSYIGPNNIQTFRLGPVPPKAFFDTLSQPPVLQPQYFGAVADGVTDCTVAFQNAVNAAIVLGMPLEIPAGPYIITDTIHITSRLAYGLDNHGVPFDDYISCIIRGTNGYALIPHSVPPGWGQDFGVSMINDSATIYYKGPKDRPAINVQGGRDIRFENFILQGENLAAVTGIDTTNRTCKENASDWITPGCSDYQYAPYAGITVDGYCGTQPTNHYPIDKVQYGQWPSSAIDFKHVAIRQFVVGVAITPSNYSGNAENIKFDKCSIEYNAYCVAVCQAQSRGVTINDCSIAGAHTLFTTWDFGTGTGQAPVITGGIFGLCYRMFNYDGSTGFISVDNIHVESCATIGMLGQGSTGGFSSAKISNGNIGLEQFKNVRPSFLWEAYLPLTFENINFTTGVNNSADLRPWYFFQANNINPTALAYAVCEFIGCVIADTAPLAFDSYHFIGSSTTTPICVSCVNTEITFNSYPQQLSDDKGYLYLPDRLVLSPNCKRVRDLTNGVNYSVNPIPMTATGICIYDSSASKNAGDYFYFDVYSGHGNDFIVGDYIYWNARLLYGTSSSIPMPYLYVTEVTPTQITARKLTTQLAADWQNYGTATPITVPILRKAFINKTQAMATWAQYSNTLTLTAPADAATNFEVGDFITAPGFQLNTRIIAMSGTQITINWDTQLAASSPTALVNTVMTPVAW